MDTMDTMEYSDFPVPRAAVVSIVPIVSIVPLCKDIYTFQRELRG